MRVANKILLIFELIILLSFFYTPWGTLTFGWGLGDLFAVILIIIGLVSHLIWFIILAKQDSKNKYFSYPFYVYLCGVFYVFYLSTYGRDINYRWDGHIFYIGCGIDIPIINDAVNKTVRIKMCSMDYESDLEIICGKIYMNIASGKLQIAPQLKKFIKKPLDKIYIKPEMETFYDGSLNEQPKFKIDTLIINEKYLITGRIEGIMDSIPIFKVRVIKQKTIANK